MLRYFLMACSKVPDCWRVAFFQKHGAQTDSDWLDTEYLFGEELPSEPYPNSIAPPTASRLYAACFAWAAPQEKAKLSSGSAWYGLMREFAALS